VRTLVLFLLAFGLAPTLLAGCGGLRASSAPPTPLGSCTLDLPAGASETDAIRAVLRAEGELVVAQEIDRLMALWAEGSRVVDAKNTPADESDDQLWLDKDAVRHRYVRTVFPGAPAAATPADLQIEIAGDWAIVTATTQIGSEVSPAGDRWELAQWGGCWAIARLVYNLEPAP
jgi:ketosteroid isomerase-like protein